MITAETKLEQAKAFLVLQKPFYASILLRLEFREDPMGGTAWTDGRTLGWNRQFLNGLPVQQVIGLLAHEVAHVAHAHHLRRGSRDPALWNQAADYAINGLLLADGFELPSDVLHDPQFAGLSTEVIYNRIADQQRQPPPRARPQGSGKGSGPQGPSSQQPTPDQPGKGSGKPDKRQGPAACGEVRDMPAESGDALSPAARVQAESELQVILRQARVTHGNECGQGSGMADRAIEVGEGQVDWLTRLRHLVTQWGAKNDYSFRRPNRRWLQAGVYAPSIEAPTLGDIVVVLDTSGSMRQGDLKRLGAEIEALLVAYPASKVTVIYCDYAVAHHQEFRAWDLAHLRLHAKGGGGTSFAPAFRWVDDQGIHPSVLIYLTDLEVDSYPEPPSYPVVWVTESVNRAPPWGDLVRVEHDVD